MPDPNEKKPRNWSKPDPLNFGSEDFDENGDDGSKDAPWVAPGHESQARGEQEKPTEES